MKRILVSLTLMLALIATCLSSCGLFPETTTEPTVSESAAAIFTLDVNPGIRIYVKLDNTVILVEATNEDGESIVAELDLEGVDYEEAVEAIIDEMENQGYLEGEESSILISVEKKDVDIFENVNDKVEKAFEKHGKKASVIEQDLDELDEKTEKTIGDMAKKHNISEGKAHLIEKIREEFPELSEEELAKLRINELRLILEETSDDVKDKFNKLGDPVETDYVGKGQALTIALESLELILDDVTSPRVRVTHGKEMMLYEVTFVYEGAEYEITVDAKTGEIVEKKQREFVEFDPDDMIDEFFDKHNIDPNGVGNINELFGNGKNDPDNDHKGEHGNEQGNNPDNNGNGETTESKPLSKGELLKGVLAELAIADEDLKKTDVKLYETERGAIYAVTVETASGDIYVIVVEAYSGTLLKATKNGAEIELMLTMTE